MESFVLSHTHTHTRTLHTVSMLEIRRRKRRRKKGGGGEEEEEEIPHRVRIRKDCNRFDVAHCLEPL